MKKCYLCKAKAVFKTWDGTFYCGQCLIALHFKGYPIEEEKDLKE